MLETYILKHKDTDTAVLELDVENCEIYDFEIVSVDDIPILGENGYRRLHEWLDSRAIPSGREELERILRNAGCETSQEYLVKNLALSLTDTYWLCPASLPDLTWTQVNLFSHSGEVLTFHDGGGKVYYSTSPDASLTGSLPKEAIHRSDGWYLRKYDGSQSGEGLQNVNEAFASLIHETQGFKEYTDYKVEVGENGVCDSCICKYFTNEQCELISAYDVTGGFTNENYNGASQLTYFIEQCERNGLDREYVENFLDYQTLTDFLITNTDRHWGNFGILRDPVSLKFISMAPIFDSGSSMLYNAPYVRNRLGILKLETNGVEKKQQDQLALVHNRKILDLSKLPSVDETCDFYVKNGVSEEHARQIANGYGFKLDMLYEFQEGETISIAREYDNLR